MRQSAILAIDQGTTGSRAILYDARGKILSSAYLEFPQYYPKPGWVEHAPEEIWQSVSSVVHLALRRAPHKTYVAALGITNQRETTLLWDRLTSRPVYPAIVWQDRRTSDFCARLKSRRGLEKTVREKTGLVLDPYFSATKIHWILQHLPKLKKKIAQGQLAFGTIDTWLLWKLTGGKVHATDPTNASRTLLYNIKTQAWDSSLLNLFSVPQSILPEIKPSGGLFGETSSHGPLPAGIPVYSMIGDQQAALYGQSCYQTGQAKNTYGTGCFLMMHLGKKYRKPPFGILATIAADRQGKIAYALEGAVFIAGAAVQWLRDGIKIIQTASETEEKIRHLKDSGGVTVIPAFVGLASPYWKAHLRGRISGITRGTTREHLIRATLESIAHQTSDVLEAMEHAYAKTPLKDLRVDGGATKNNFLMQFQSDLLQIPVLVSPAAELTAWGAAKLAGRMIHFWDSDQKIDQSSGYKKFKPRLRHAAVQPLRVVWKSEITNLLESV